MRERERKSVSQIKAYMSDKSKSPSSWKTTTYGRDIDGATKRNERRVTFQIVCMWSKRAVDEKMR